MRARRMERYTCALPAARACARVSVPRPGKRMTKRGKSGQQSSGAPRERVRVLITGGRIQRRIQALAQEIRKDFPGEPLHLVSVLKGGVFFLTDLARLFQQRKPKHLRVAVLLDKPERRIAAVHADYVGFSIPNEFVVGYGLDYAERYRNLPYVGVLLIGPGLKKKPAED